MTFPCLHIVYSPFWDGTLGFITSLCIFPQPHIFSIPMLQYEGIISSATGVVSLTFGELSKILSRNLCITEIVPHFVWEFEAEIVYVLNPCCGTRTKFQLETLIINVISGILYFRKIILETSWNVSESTPRHLWLLCYIQGPFTSFKPPERSRPLVEGTRDTHYVYIYELICSFGWDGSRINWCNREKGFRCHRVLWGIFPSFTGYRRLFLDYIVHAIRICIVSHRL